MNTTVALQKCNDYEFDLVYQKIRQLFELVPPPDVKGKTVLLKPNILYPKKPDLAVGTHPIVMGAAVKAFYDIGAAKVIAGESPAISNSTSAAKSTGIYEQVVSNGGTWVDFHESYTVPSKDGKVTAQFELAVQLQEADLIVSMCKLKSHQFMSYTGAMKNLFGCMIGLQKAQMHYRYSKKEDFGSFLVDLNQTINAQYAIMDAIVGMEGPGGPGSGDPIKLGFLAASDNLLALDWECSSLVGYDPHKVVYLEEALKRGFWLKSPSEIQVAGEKRKNVRNLSFKIVKDASPTLGKMLPKGLDMAAKAVFVKTPRFNPKKCIKCKRCETICPPHVIKMEGKDNSAILTDRTKCLHCFCCHEICPAGAIKLRRF